VHHYLSYYLIVGNATRCVRPASPFIHYISEDQTFDRIFRLEGSPTRGTRVMFYSLGSMAPFTFSGTADQTSADLILSGRLDYETRDTIVLDNI
jgi:hypothetical protein